MKDKNKDQLIKEVAELRQHISHLKKFEKECKLAMGSLQRGEERYRHFVENSPNPIFSIDEKGIIKSWNRACENTFQYDKSIIGKNYIVLLSTSEDQKVIKPAIKKAFQGQSLSDIDIYFKAKDETELFMVSRLYPLIDNDRRIRECVFANTNITERKKAEIALRESELKYRNLIEESLQSIVIIQDGVIVFSNPALSEITGYSNDELLSFKLGQLRVLVHPDDREMVWKRLDYRLAGEDVPSYYEMRAIRKDGTVCWFEMFAKRIDYRGRPAVQAAFIDITDRKKAEEELKKSEIKYRSLVEDAAAGIATTDLRGKLTFVNNALCNMIGYSQKDLIGKSFADFLHPDNKNRILQIFHDAIKQHKGGMPLEFRIIHKKGHTVYMYSKPTPFIFNDKIVGFNAIITDITEMKQFEEALQESEHKYRTLVEKSLQGISIIQDNRFIFVNPALAEITGYTVDELLALTAKEMEKTIHPDDFALIKKRFEDFAAGRDIIPQYVFRAIRKDGTVRWVEVFSNLITYKGRPARQVAYMDITERKKAEEALREQEQRLSDIIQHLPDSTCVIDREGKVIAWNRALEELTGVKAEEMLGKGNHEYSLPFYGKRRPVLMDLVLQPHNHNKEIEKLYPFVKKDGDTLITENYIPSLKDGIYIWVQARPLYDSQGNIVGAISTVRDITESKRAQEALMESEEKFRNIFEHASEAIYTVDLEGNFTSGNRMAANITGYPRDELIGRHFFTIVIEDDEQKAVESFKHTLKGKHHSFSLRIRRKDGEIRTLSVHAAPFAKGGKIIGSQGIARDITEQLKLEIKLKESEERFKGIFENAHDAIIVINRNGVITLANPMFFELSGFSKQDLSKIHLSQIIHPQDSNYILMYFNRAISGEVGYKRFISRGITKDGAIRYLDINANVIIKDDDVVGIQAILRDITESKALEEKLRENYKELIKTIAGFLEIKDLYTEKHSRRIVEDSIYLASKLNMNEEEIKDIEIGALLHDLGKIKIPGKILNKGTKFNKKEEQIMRKHSQLGEEAIKNIPEFRNASKLIRHHHERYDGEGYPDKLKGEEIPLGARIIALIDAFDAMLSDRPYRKALTYEEAKQELIREKGKQFDPYLTNIYLRYLESKYENK
jgi:PAS domain S-box-containing protein